MSRAEIFSGICGFTTLVDAHMEGEACALEIQSDCKSVQRLGEALTQVDPMREISKRGDGPLTWQLSRQFCPHTACPVSSGIIKAVEVAAGLALPADATIKVSS